MAKRFLFFLIFFIHLSFIIPSLSAEQVKILSVEMKRDRGFDYLDIYTSGFSEAKGLLLENKLYLDFPGTQLDPKIEISRRKSKRIEKIEVAQKDKETARIVVTLKKEIEYDIVNVFGRDKSVVEIGDRTDTIFAYQSAWESKNVLQRGDPLKTVRLAPREGISLRGKVIILDPGHGGDDPGAFSAGGVPEKVYTLQTAKKAARLLQDEGATVYLTRDEDRRANLKDIVAFANRSGADLFISIHYNSIYTPKIGGTETYYYNPVSRVFAEKMHEAIVRGIKRKDHGLHRTPFYVVKNTEVPSVLLEPVYLSHPEESGLAGSASFQEELAEDIVRGVKDYCRSRVR
jgi:N-acetylmuramoyl-L-alanine amidase